MNIKFVPNPDLPLFYTHSFTQRPWISDTRGKWFIAAVDSNPSLESRHDLELSTDYASFADLANAANSGFEVPRYDSDPAIRDLVQRLIDSKQAEYC